MKGHRLQIAGDPCQTCAANAAADAAFQEQLRNPPAELVIRDHAGRPTFYRIPKHLQRRRLPPGRRTR